MKHKLQVCSSILIILLILCGCKQDYSANKIVDYNGTKVKIPQSITLEKSGEQPVTLTDEQEIPDFAANFVFAAMEGTGVEIQATEMEEGWQYRVTFTFSDGTTDYYLNGNHLHVKNSVDKSVNSYQITEDVVKYLADSIDTCSQNL